MLWGALKQEPGQPRAPMVGACSGAFLDESRAVSPREGNPELLVFPSRPFDAKNPFLAMVTENRKLNEGGERHLMHLELDISNSKIR